MKPGFVYVTYIATTPERLWEALTRPEFTQQYWFGRRVESDWRVGSPVRQWSAEGELADSGEVLEATAPRRLSYSWRVEHHPELRREGHSRVTFELEPAGDTVKLTVIHDEFVPGSAVLEGVSRGWPMILASLKSLLETGRPLALTRASAAKGEEAANAPAARS